MSQKRKVAIIDNSMDITGAIKAILHFCEFSKDRYLFTFLLPLGSRVSIKIQEEGYEVIEQPFVEISKNWRNLLIYLPRLFVNAHRLRRIILDKKIDIVHVNDFYNLTAVLAKILGKNFPLITHVRFMPNRFPSVLVKIWIGLNLKYATYIVCVSEAVKKYLPAHSKIQVIHDGMQVFDLENGSIPSVSEKETIDLLYLGHFIPGKGQNLALEAFYKSFLKKYHLRLRFVGGDMGLKKNQEFRKCLEERTKTLGLTRVVTFDGPSHNIRKDILTADIVLNFSESESFSMICLEALMLGRPLIATDCGGPSELFLHGKSGWLVENGNINSMAKAIEELSENAELRREFSKNCVNYVKSKFSPNNTTMKLEQLYLNVLSC